MLMNLDTSIGRMDLEDGSHAHVNDADQMHVEQLIREKGSLIDFDEAVPMIDQLKVMANAMKGTDQEFYERGGLLHISREDFDKIVGGQLQNVGDSNKVVVNGTLG